METLWRDLRFGVRMLLRHPGVTAVALLGLALGIGANSAIFSVFYAVLLRPLPVRDAGRVVTLALVSKKLNVTGAQPGFSEYARWRADGRSFESVAAASPGTAAYSAGSGQQSVKLWRVTAGFLPTLGVEPVLGRNFTDQEDRPGGARTALVSNGFWRGRLNADPRVLGTTIPIDEQRYIVVGVLPPGFHVDGRPADVYTPMARSLNSPDWLPADVYARLRPGVTLAQAQAELDARVIPHPLGWKPHLWLLRDFQVRNVRTSLWVLLGAVGLVLLIACSNTATLLLARASAREREMAVRSALGAGWKRLARQLLTESTLLALVGGGCGIVVAVVCARLVPLIHYDRLPALISQTRVDGAVLAFTLAASLLTGLLFGTAPAVAAARAGFFDTLKEGAQKGGGVRRGRAGSFLVVSEIALAVVLAIGASLLIRTFFYLRDAAPGFAVDNLVTARVTPPRGRFTSAEQCVLYWQTLMDRVRRIPGVQAASFAQTLPLTGEVNVGSWPVEGHPFSPRPEELVLMWERVTDPEYFHTMRIPLRQGRLFDARDSLGAPKVALVNEAFVRRFWPDGRAVGRHIGGALDMPLHEVVGVVADVRVEDLTKPALPEVYRPARQVPGGRIALAIRTDARSLEPALRKAVAEVDPGAPLSEYGEMKQIVSDRVASNRISAQLIAIFAALALVLAAVGIYGVLSFSVAQRTHEIGIRVALGAARSGVLGMVLGEAALLAGLGVGIGTAAALALQRVLVSLVHGAGTASPGVYLANASVLMAIALIAAALPAYRAARLDPLTALRHE